MALRFFPFGEHFEPGMGGRSLTPQEPLIDVDLAHYAAEVALKRAQLRERHQDYFLAPPELASAQWEVLEVVLADLARHHPQHFELQRDGSRVVWQNRLLGEEQMLTLGEEASLPLAPLDWVGRQVQEDLVLVRADADGTLVGGQLCFPNGWDLPERAGLSYQAIHVSTPGSTMVGVQAGGRLLQSLKPDRIFCRIGWNLKLSSQLDLSTKYLQSYLEHAAERAPQLDAQSVGRELYLRLERQTFLRLKRSQHVLFGIHTYLSPFEVEAADPERARRLLAVLSEAPDDVKRYKAVFALERALFTFLRERAARAPGHAAASARSGSESSSRAAD